MSLHHIPVRTVSNEPTTLESFSGSALLIVNVASQCGLTPQYAGLERLHQFEKIVVNGDGRHPLYDALTRHADSAGNSGDVQWNFEKFLVSPAGSVVARFRPRTEPEADEVVAAVEASPALTRLPTRRDRRWSLGRRSE